MTDYGCIVFDLYGTLIDDSQTGSEREQLRLDNIFTTLEKSLFPIKFKALQKAYGEMTVEMSEYQDDKKVSYTPYRQVECLLEKLSVRDVVVFKKVYDAYTDAVLEISPKLMKNAKEALALLSERGKKIGLISNTGRSPGHVLRFLLKELGIASYFTDMTFSDEAGVIKPDPLIFDIALRKLGSDPRDTLFVGDLKSIDYDGALRAGLNAHLFSAQSEDLLDLAAKYSGGY